jgi:hypothetical protein
MQPGLNQGNAKRLIDAAQQAVEDLEYLHAEYLEKVEQVDPSDLKFYHPRGSCTICRKTIPVLRAVLAAIRGNGQLGNFKPDQQAESFDQKSLF